MERQGSDLKQTGNFVDMMECLVRKLSNAKGTVHLVQPTTIIDKLEALLSCCSACGKFP